MYIMPESSGINFIKKLECLSVIAALILLTSINPLQDLCANVGPHKNETLNKFCDWSTWYPWNCECCSMYQFQFRKRAICCEKTGKLPDCLQKCNYSEKSDTSYKNCSTDCTTNAGLKCQETAPLSLFASTSSPNSKQASVTTTSHMLTNTTQSKYGNAAKAPVGVVIGAACASLIVFLAILIAVIILLKRKTWKRR
ncbi:uncharacterized protein LOC132746091 [Ruditapes philippinarum]|uniref:uncharacterized protein LOC132746091 n=1 Tax=Ruditapes philippinarum TaxID=129788 RepID=UPI00295AEA53|nr:uncharacterized protein LOC132746091 [Ruditapes philippinarum]